MIYLDYAASTPLHPLLMDKLKTAYALLGNVQSDQMVALHQVVLHSQKQICDYFHGDPKRLFFTSGATESISTAIIGACRFYQTSGNHIIAFETEHKAVLYAYEALSSEGFKVTILPVLSDGRVDYQALEAAITDQTIMVSINGVCNETGLIQDLKPLMALKQHYGFMVHLDACQMVGKVEMDIQKTPVDYMTLSSHKQYGPQGIGALYIAKGRHLKPIIQGNDKVRSGTLSVALIMLMGEAYAIAKADFNQNHAHINKLRQRFLKGLEDIEHTVLSEGVPGILNIRFHNASLEDIAKIREAIYCQLSSACSSGLSHVLQARLPYQQAKQCIRFSFGIMTTEAECDEAVAAIEQLLG